MTNELQYIADNATGIIVQSTPMENQWVEAGGILVWDGAWSHRTRLEAVVHTVMICGDDSIDPGLEEESENESRVLGCAVHHVLSHLSFDRDAMENAFRTKVLYCDYWENASLLAREEEDDHTETLDGPAWLCEYLEQGLNEGGNLPRMRQLIRKTALSSLIETHGSPALENVQRIKARREQLSLRA